MDDAMTITHIATTSSNCRTVQSDFVGETRPKALVTCTIRLRYDYDTLRHSIATTLRQNRQQNGILLNALVNSYEMSYRSRVVHVTTISWRVVVVS